MVAFCVWYSEHMLQVLRPGTRHPHVLMWEEFLRGYGFYLSQVDVVFDPTAVEATKKFQRANGLKVDGWVGPATWGKAVSLGLDIVRDDADDAAIFDDTSASWPARPTDLEPLGTTSDRQRVWGKFRYESAPHPLNPEAIKILDDWPDKNIVSIAVPQIAQILGIRTNRGVEGVGPRMVSVHRLVMKSFVEMWQVWAAELLLDRVLTYAGDWVPRFVRGSRTSLSNHAFGTAFDINAPWNGLRRIPARVGQRGCVRELVGIANHYGWWWGGHGWPVHYDRLDGMHFEATEKAIR